MAKVLGFDLGGTKLAWVSVNDKGRIDQYQSIPLYLNKSKSPLRSQRIVVETISKIVSEKWDSKLIGVGIASAGPLNVATGQLIHPTNFAGWGKYNLIESVKAELKKKKKKVPLFFQNDAMAAALGEGWLGRAKGINSYVTITLGTGIGTGIIVNGQPVQCRGMGAEWGNQIINWKDLKFNSDHAGQTVEGIASGPAIINKAFKLGFRGSTVEELILEIIRGNNSYRQIFYDVATALAVLCFNLSIGFHPERIIFSGGLIGAREYFFDDLMIKYKHLVESHHKSFKAPLQIAKLGVQAGAIGAARLPLMGGPGF